jgi:hypothetical protein
MLAHFDWAIIVATNFLDVAFAQMQVDILILNEIAADGIVGRSRAISKVR